MPRILVYSCIAGKYDNASNSLFNSLVIPEPGVDFCLFTDQKIADPKRLWAVLPLRWQHPSCGTRTARWHKVNSHLISDGYDYAVWIDGTMRIKHIRICQDLILPYQDYLLYTFKHPLRNCVYQELDACKKLKKDNAALMEQQVNVYRNQGYPAHNGMVETGCVVRKFNHVVSEFNSAWWRELDKYSYRDQLSFNYTCWRLGFRYGHIPGSGRSSPFFDYFQHTKH